MKREKPLSNLVNHGHLEYFRDVYCIMTNHTVHLDIWEVHQSIKYLLIQIIIYYYIFQTLCMQ